MLVSTHKILAGVNLNYHILTDKSAATINFDLSPPGFSYGLLPIALSVDWTCFDNGFIC